MKRENRYLVLKEIDIQRCLNRDQINVLAEFVDEIKGTRDYEGKRDTSYVVVGDDWPMYEDTWRAIEQWVDTGEYKTVESIQNALATAERERERLELENTILRGMTAKHMPCRYCGVDEIAKCPQGFPGCGLADDILCAQDEQMRHMLAELAELRREVKRVRPVFKAAVVLVTRWMGNGHAEYLEMICDSADDDDSDLAELMLIEQFQKLTPVNPSRGEP